jgi:hypothetical protein
MIYQQIRIIKNVVTYTKVSYQSQSILFHKIKDKCTNFIVNLSRIKVNFLIEQLIILKKTEIICFSLMQSN